MLKFRSEVISSIRDFFSSRDFLETDTPALASALIPESCLEVFRTEYIKPFKEGREAAVPYFLLPSPELYIKKLIAAHGISIFQISKCYRNCESTGRLHSPEFTMLEYYKINASAVEMKATTMEMIQYVIQRLEEKGFCPLENVSSSMNVTFNSMTIDDAFSKYTGISFRDEGKGKTGEKFHTDLKDKLVETAVKEGLGERQKLSDFSLHDLYDMIFIQCVEPEIAGAGPVFLTDYPAFVPCLASEKPRESGNAYTVRDRWELYASGVELANCYTEERNSEAVRAFFKEEERLKGRARINHPADRNFAEICAGMPPCSGVAMGVDRLLMFLSGRKTIDSVLPFPMEIAGF